VPNRYIRESLLTSPNFNKLSMGAENYCVRTFLIADDFGCFESTAEVVKGRCFALKFEVTIDDIQKWREESEKHEMIYTWTHNGRQYSVFRTFSRHNYLRSLHKRKTPAPPPDIEKKLLAACDEWQKVYGKRASGKPIKPSTDSNKKLAEMVKYYEISPLGMVTPIIADRLKDIADNYSLEEFREALQETVERGGRSIGYLEKILAQKQDNHTEEQDDTGMKVETEEQ